MACQSCSVRLSQDVCIAVFHSSTHLRNHVEKDSDGVTTADGVAKLLEVAGEALDEEPTEDTREDKLDNSMTPIDLESLFFEINSISAY